jgi:hypothetical protein
MSSVIEDSIASGGRLLMKTGASFRILARYRATLSGKVSTSQV